MTLRERLFGGSGPRRERIDPFTLGEPWRRLVQDAQTAESQFHEAVRGVRRGPFRDRLDDIGHQVGAGVDECWRVAQAGHALSRARSRIDIGPAERQAATANAGDETERATAASLQAQIDAADRMDRTIGTTRDTLQVLNARLDEAVTRAIELSVSATTGGELSTVGDDLSSITVEIEALRQGIAAVQGLENGR